MVVLFGFFVMGLLAYRTYTGEAPIPARTISPDQKLLFTRHPRRPTDIPEEWPDGVWLHLWTRRVFGTGSYSRLSAPVGNQRGDPEQARQLTAFFAWSAWVSAALRPGHNYSYTSNWPPEPLVNNTVMADNIVWSGASK